MNAAEFTVHCGEPVGSVPALSHAVMGNMSYNLLGGGVRLQRTLEEICGRPLLRRTMGTLCTGIGIDKGTGVYREDDDGRPAYDFTIMDQVLDVIVGPRSTPFFGICFMPEDLSAAGSPRPGEAADAALPPEAGGKASPPKLAEPWMRIDRFPPKDYARWHDLVHAVVRHAVERYGREMVERWYWDFWNEPDLRFYWIGSHEEFMKTYDYAAAAVKSALPSAKVGGCGPADPSHPIFGEFLEHCTRGKNHCTGSTGAPLDFITFHMKGGPTGRKGIFTDPWQASGYEQGTPSLRHIIDATRRAMQAIASVEGTAGLPVFLTECDIDWGTGTSIYHNPNMHYRNSEYFAAWQCALATQMLDLREEFPDNPVEATFLDTFYIPGHRVFEGQRTLITGETIDKPILNALRLLGKLGRSRLRVGPPNPPPVEVLATAGEDESLSIMAVNFDEAFEYDQSHALRIALHGLGAGQWRCRHYRIDRDHSNAHTVWQSLGRPVVPDDEQLAAIQNRQGLEVLEPDRTIQSDGQDVCLHTTLPPQSVSLWVLEAVKPGGAHVA